MVRHGFTLVEMMIAVAIVGTMMALASANYIEMRKVGESREETRQLVSYLRNARTLAVTRQVPHGVYVGGQGDTEAPLFRNRMVLFSKVDSETAPASFDYNPATDLVVTDHFMPSTGRGATASNGTLVVDALEADANSSFRVVFDTDGTPTVFYHQGGALSPTTWNPGPAGERIVTSLRHITKGVRAQNFTTRCVGLLRTGESMVVTNTEPPPFTLAYCH